MDGLANTVVIGSGRVVLGNPSGLSGIGIGVACHGIVVVVGTVLRAAIVAIYVSTVGFGIAVYIG